MDILKKGYDMKKWKVQVENLFTGKVMEVTVKANTERKGIIFAIKQANRQCGINYGYFIKSIIKVT